MIPDFNRYPTKSKIGADLSMTLTGSEDIDCLLTVSGDEKTVSKEISPHLFDPGLNRQPSKENELAEWLAQLLGRDSQTLTRDFRWAIMEIRGEINQRRGIVHQFNPMFGVKTCVPPKWNVTQLNKEERWKEIEDRYLDWVSRDSLEVWEDDPGTGKTTSTSRGAVESGRSHVLYLPTHQNCREFVDEEDDSKPDGYYYLRGANRLQNGCCADADHHGKTCSEHPEHPTMCPVYELDEDHPKRSAYEWLASEKGGSRAHDELNLYDEPWHDDEACPWERQFDELKTADRIVTVHAYLGLSVEGLNNVDDHIIDDLQNVPAIDRQVTVSELTEIKNTLSELVDVSSIGPVFRSLQSFANNLETVLETRKGSLDSISPKSFNPPSWVTKRCSTSTDAYVESLAWARQGYVQYYQKSISTKDSRGIPAAIDFLIISAGLADGGISLETARRAISAPTYFDSCPRCGSSFKKVDKNKQPISNTHHPSKPNRDCGSCGWSEQFDSLTTKATPQARSTAWLKLPKKTNSSGNGMPTIEYQRVRSSEELPPADDTLILDATPTLDQYAHLFEVSTDSIHREGIEAIKPNADVTQIVNGQYSRSTICDDKPGADRRREKIQRIIDSLCLENDHVILVGHQRAKKYFKIPENTDWIDYYVGRGLDFPDADAIVLIGAPFPNKTSLDREAEALTVGRDVKLGDVLFDKDEYAGYPDIDSRRAYWYMDGNENGYSVEIKPRYGFVGKLFTDAVEHELVQMLHRIRPVLADETKEIYLLTNIPLSVPVTTLTTLDDLESAAASSNVEILGPKADELLSIAMDLFGRHPNKKRLSDAWKVTDDVVQGTVDDFLTVYLDKIGDVSRPSIQNGLDELREIDIISRSETKQGRAGYVYTFPNDRCSKLEFVVEQSGSLSLTDRQRLDTHVQQSKSHREDWLNRATEIVTES